METKDVTGFSSQALVCILVIGTVKWMSSKKKKINKKNKSKTLFVFCLFCGKNKCYRGDSPEIFQNTGNK